MDEHELASQVLAIVDEAAYRNAATRVSTIHLAIGGRRVLDLNRLQAVFAVAARGTVAESVHLSVWKSKTKADSGLHGSLNQLQNVSCFDLYWSG